MDFYVIDKAGGIPADQNKGILRFSCEEIHRMLGKHKGPIAANHEQLIDKGYVDIAHFTGLDDPTELNSISPIHNCEKLTELLVFDATIENTIYEKEGIKPVKTVYVK
ncbi:MAG: hypothetical protein KAJ91_03550 [Candidatus Aenigmarchaeota archaeon]|nr:hypothetical protein [Candidatus Aenigmarchaeota archaeon]MCK5334221.1 hypothetical protein [Candidatus Aenigmarchaeota archaeon]